jgi:hypothetical protein
MTWALNVANRSRHVSMAVEMIRCRKPDTYRNAIDAAETSKLLQRVLQYCQIGARDCRVSRWAHRHLWQVSGHEYLCCMTPMEMSSAGVSP